MDYDNAIEIEDEEDEVQLVNRRVILEPAIRNVVSALGGVESSTYRLGDECYGCLKDLKKIWRRDDTDDDRTVARIFYEVLVLPNDLIPILLSTAGAGELEDKRAIAAADLICALTWPIDLAEELKELDEELDARADFTQLLRSHLHYKRALLKPGVLQALFSLVIPCLSRDVKADRAQTERDTQIVHLVLYIIRNLAFVKDPAVTGQSSAEANELATMQSRLVQALHDTHVYDLLLTIAANANVDARFNSWNVTVLEILYLLLRGVKADVLAAPPAEVGISLSIPYSTLIRFAATQPKSQIIVSGRRPAASEQLAWCFLSTLSFWYHNCSISW
jgi:replication fork protection complex subunit Tof1/Swi1